MDTFKVKLSSWHYHIASNYGSLSQWELDNGRLDFCSYSRSVMKGLLLALLISSLITLLLIPITFVLSWLAVSLVTSTWVTPNSDDMGFWIGTVELVIMGLLTLLTFGFLAHEKLKENNIRLFPKVSPPGFIVQAYDGFKNKYCIRVEVEQKGSDQDNKTEIQPETSWPKQ